MLAIHCQHAIRLRIIAEVEERAGRIPALGKKRFPKQLVEIYR